MLAGGAGMNQFDRMSRLKRRQKMAYCAWLASCALLFTAWACCLLTK